MSSFEAANPAALSHSLEALIGAASSGVVTIKAAAYRSASAVLLPNNLLAVANHTVRRTDKIPVHTATGTKGEASVVGRDEGIDLAILKSTPLDATPLEHGDPATLKPGSLAAVVGMTSDVGASASLGIIGAVGDGRGTWRGGRLDRFIRLDVNLYPSQSGAAVIDAEGKLIGMATPALSRHAAMAIPAATLARLAEQVQRDGGLRHGYIGVGVQPVAIQPSSRTRLNLQQNTGLMLVSVEDSSPAESAGLLLGDILLEVEGAWVREPEDLQGILRSTAIGKELRLSILHGGEVETRTVTVGERINKSK